MAPSSTPGPSDHVPAAAAASAAVDEDDIVETPTTLLHPARLRLNPTSPPRASSETAPAPDSEPPATHTIHISPPPTTSSPAAPASTKGQCWCCWESTDTPANPLIRACLGCKDPDLQYIHQECIDRWVTALPPPRTPPPHVHACSRCGDPYRVVVTPIPRVQVLLADPFLRLAMLLMVGCIGVLTLCCVALIVQHWGTGLNIIDLGGWIQVRMTVFAGVMLVFCHAINAATCWMVWEHCGGEVGKHVVGVDEDAGEGEGDGQGGVGEGTSRGTVAVEAEVVPNEIEGEEGAEDEEAAPLLVNPDGSRERLADENLRAEGGIGGGAAGWLLSTLGSFFGVALPGSSRSDTRSDLGREEEEDEEEGRI
ncbi:hypothetical protein HK101_003353 [Irineochytrium annulatum]|nr:hypothetical protein HK101_003353 [Irineochytrium annulatum]